MKINRPIGTLLTIIALAGCMSNEDAAEEKFQQVLKEMGLDSDDTRRASGLLDPVWEKIGNFTLCQVLRRAMGDDPGNQSWIFTKGHYIEAMVWALGIGGGMETAFDVANYQVGKFAMVYGELFKAIPKVKARGGWYRGIIWGHHTSVLDVAGPRVGGQVSWFPPILKFFADITARAMVLPPVLGRSNILFGGQLGFELGPRLSVTDTVPWTQLFPRIRLEGGYAWPWKEGINIPFTGVYGLSTIAERDADLGAKLNTRCGEDKPFVQYDGAAEDEGEGYHTRRAKALAKAMERDSKLLNIITDPGALVLSKAIVGLGVARDHGGFGAVCGGDEGGLDESPVPEPRCPDNPDLNPEEPETAGADGDACKIFYTDTNEDYCTGEFVTASADSQKIGTPGFLEAVEKSSPEDATALKSVNKWCVCSPVSADPARTLGCGEPFVLIVEPKDGSAKRVAAAASKACVKAVEASSLHDPGTTTSGCHKYPLFDLRFCSSDCKCGEGQGDCDGDDECEDGLKCVEDGGELAGGSASVDVCAKDPNATVAPGEPVDDPIDEPVDNPGTAPTATFLSPQNGDTVGTDVDIELSISDESQVAEVNLLVDGNFEHRWTEAPFSVTLALEPGEHTLMAVVLDHESNMTDTGNITIIVDGERSGSPTVPPEGTPGGYTGLPEGYGQQPGAPKDSSGCSLSGSHPEGAVPLVALLLLGLVTRRRRG